MDGDQAQAGREMAAWERVIDGATGEITKAQALEHAGFDMEDMKPVLKEVLAEGMAAIAASGPQSAILSAFLLGIKFAQELDRG